MRAFGVRPSKGMTRSPGTEEYPPSLLRRANFHSSYLYARSSVADCFRSTSPNFLHRSEKEKFIGIKENLLRTTKDDYICLII